MIQDVIQKLIAGHDLGRDEAQFQRGPFLTYFKRLMRLLLEIVSDGLESLVDLHRARRCGGRFPVAQL